ncbi:MAG: hypothetical protein ACFCUG_15850 [Thiotrichales bacterium]
MKEIATRKGIDNSYVSRMVNLTTQAPDIVAAILETRCQTTSRDSIWRLIPGRCGMSSADVKRLALVHVAELRQKLGELEDMASTLETLAACCHGNDRPDCPILSELEAPSSDEVRPVTRLGVIGSKSAIERS